MLTEQGGFDEISAASQFTYYFGNNWDALDECINDLEWMPADNYVFVFFDFDVILREWEPETVEILLRVFHDAAIEWSVPVKIGEAWDRDAKPFHIIFHQERNADIEVLQSIKKYGYEIRQIL